MKPLETIQAFDEFLSDKNESLSAVVVGGGALYLLGVITRETQDIDVLEPLLSEKITGIAKEFAAKSQERLGVRLKPGWLNNGPRSLLDILPNDWQDRAQKIFSGKALTLFSLGRQDLLKTKLFAFCDRDQDKHDCLMLCPSREELLDSVDWVKNQDKNPGWPKHVETSLKALAKDLGYEL